MNAYLTRRSMGASLMGAALLALAGCSSAPPKPKPEPLPAVTAASVLKPIWSLRLGSGASTGFQPAVVDGHVWAASARGEVIRVELATGRLLWKADVGKALVAGVGSDGSIGVVAGRDGSLIAIDVEGKVRWSVTVGSEIVTVPSVGNGLIVLRSSDNRVSAWDAETGRRRWTFQRQLPALVLRQTGAPTVAGDAVYVGLPGGRLAALGLQTGALRWESAVSVPRGSNEIERIADVVGMPVATGRDVCAATFNGRLGCFDQATGRALWARDLSATHGPASDGTQVAAIDDMGRVHVFSRSGASVWRNDAFRHRKLSGPAILPAAIVFGDSQGGVHALARDDGAVLSRLPTDGSALLGSPLADGRNVVVQTAAGGLFAFGQD